MLKKLITAVMLLMVLTFSAYAASKKPPMPTEEFIRYCATGKYSFVRNGIRRGAELNKVTDFFTPLIAAAQFQDNARVITLLISSGADPDFPNHQGLTPLMAAAIKNKRKGITEALLKGGASPHAVDMTGSTATYYAAQGNNTSALAALLKAAPETADFANAGGMTPLEAAIRSNSSEAQKLLREAGAER